MTVVLSGYQIGSAIYTGTRTLVYRGVRESDNQAVVIKFLRNAYPNFSELLQFRNQYTIAKNLNISGIVRPESLETYGNSYALVMADGGGISLREYDRTHCLELTQVLAIALQLAQILHELHAERVLHKDIKPANILIHPDTKQVQLIDFSLASLLPKETQEIKNPNGLEGTLAYLAPEQTGRMNRGIDYRADFYTLGVTLFELLAGQLPFQSDDPMELVHCHIAQQPPSLTQFNIPEVLADIVLKLMAKNAEDRYQSALGLKHDLEICLDRRSKTGEIERFEIGTRDLCDRFNIPEKLYGRESEVKTLLDAFERVSNGTSELMLVAGFSGIGKTAVVNEVHKPIVRQRGYFIKGKFDQFNRNIPFSAFVRAFRELMGQLLGERDTQLATWKAKMLQALGDNAQVIIEVIPELERIIGQQPPVPELSGSAAQNRFNLLFQKFISVFTTKEHPLVIFLDDLQWADSASLNLLKLLMSEANAGYLLFLGAYRDNEVFPAHPLMLTLEEIEKCRSIVNTITLAPLSEATVNQLVADTLSCTPQLAQPLTRLVYQKTKGNPFFITQFLKALHEEGWMEFQPELGYWQCDMTSVRQLALTDDVVEFMALQLQKLPVETQEVLKLAACIGNQFELETLAIVLEQSSINTATYLWKALQEGLIIPINETYKFFQSNDSDEGNRCDEIVVTYKFLHDRVQQAAYLLIPDDRKKMTHLKIGQLLLSKTPQEAREDRIFDIVNQLNYGIDLISQPYQKAELVKLNLSAARKAKNSTAYTATLSYTKTASQLLEADCWKTQYELALSVYKEWAEAEYLTGHFDDLLELADRTLKQVKSSVDRGDLYNLLILMYTMTAQYSKALQISRKALFELGIDLPQENFKSALDEELSEYKIKLASREIASLIDEPEMVIPEKKVAAKILINTTAACYSPNYPLWKVLIAKLVNLSLHYGNTPESAAGYSAFGVICGDTLNDYQAGFEFGLLALNLSDKFNDLSYKCIAANFVANHLLFWVKHIKLSVDLNNRGYLDGLESGNWQWVGYIFSHTLLNQYFQGVHVDELLQESKKYLLFSQKTQNQWAIDAILGIQLALENLNKLTRDKHCFDIPLKTEEQFLEECRHQPIANGFFIFHRLKSQILYLYGSYGEALNSIMLAEKAIASVPHSISIPEHYFYYSLILLKLYSKVTESEKTQYLDRVKINQQQMNLWAENCQENFRHKYLLVAAEISRIAGEDLAAIDLYEEAIQSAKEHGFIQHEALANELAAKFYLDWGKEKIASSYMQSAYYCYAKWGAKAKTDDLEKRYPQLLQPILQQAAQPLTVLETLASIATSSYSIHSTRSHSSSSTSLNNTLDFAALLKVSQAISSTIQLDELIQTLTQTMRENSGADKCALMLCHDGTWQVRAIADLQQTTLQTVPLEDNLTLPVQLIYYVKNTLETIVLDNLKTELPVALDPYLQQNQPKSVLCLPILNQGNLTGILYLENRATRGVFTSDRLVVLNFLCTQAAISLENARLYRQVQQTLEELQQAQLQLVQSEKMSALGNLVAGVAHEINNPIGCIVGNVGAAQDYINDLLGVIDLYGEKFPQPGADIEEELEALDLDYVREDLPKLIRAMKDGGSRITSISQSLRTFSRADSDTKQKFNLHDGIDSTVLILRHRLKANEHRPAIEVVTDYGQIPEIACFPGQLNQVFMNILANAIDVLDESNTGKKFEELEKNPNRITIQTSITDCQVKIAIGDNGIGMSEEIKQKIFDHLFTTKGVGKGTGLGLAIARQIIVEKHQGAIEVNSTLGKGTKFIILLPAID